LQGQVPDKRVAISAPINNASQTTLADGKITLVIFRRDLVTSAPEHVELRVVAKVMRAMTFDRSGKSSIAPVGETWTVRNISHPFRVAPLPGNPEMMVLKSEQPDFSLPSGRYAVVIKEQAMTLQWRAQSPIPVSAWKKLRQPMDRSMPNPKNRRSRALTPFIDAPRALSPRLTVSFCAK